MAWSKSFEPDQKIKNLFEAFDAIEYHDSSNGEVADKAGGSPDQRKCDYNRLIAWATDYSDLICEDIIVVENLEDSHRGKRLMNLGSPLYLSIVRDNPKAAKVLLTHGADPNYAHPTHGDTPLLHAAERGYDECLRVLLNERVDPKGHITLHKKFMLGQGLPQYEEGGLNPLSVAVRNGRAEIVDLLVSMCPPHVLGCWLNQKDSIGRTVIQNVFDYIELADGTSQKMEDLKAIAKMLTLAHKMNTNDGCVGFPSKVSREEALERLKIRNSAVRAMCVMVERARKENERKRGLQTVEDHYIPLHPSLYAKTASGRGLGSICSRFNDIKEPIPGVFTFKLLDPHFCSMVWEEIHNYEKAASCDPKLQLPLRVRHDGNIADLQDCGFKPLLDTVAGLCCPIFPKCLPDGTVSEASEYDVHAFVTRNYVGRECNATFRIHQDKSLLTLNICVHASDDFAGSTVGFYNSPGEGEDLPPDEKDRIYTHTHEVGHAIIHNSNAWHKTDPITRGTRGSLIVWLQQKEVQE